MGEEMTDRGSLLETSQAVELGEAVGALEGLMSDDICSESPTHHNQGRLRTCKKTAVDDQGEPLKIWWNMVHSSDLCETCHTDSCGHQLIKAHNKGGYCQAPVFVWPQCHATCFRMNWDLSQKPIWKHGRFTPGADEDFVCTKMCNPGEPGELPGNLKNEIGNGAKKGTFYCDAFKQTSCSVNPQYDANCTAADAKDCPQKLNCTSFKELHCNRICSKWARNETSPSQWIKHDPVRDGDNADVCRKTCDRKYCDNMAAYF